MPERAPTSQSDSELADALEVAAQHYLDATPWAEDARQAALPTTPEIRDRRRVLAAFLAGRR